VLVTGGSGNLGSAMAIAMSRAGADTVICGRDRDRLDRTARAIHETTGGAVVGVPMDLTDPATLPASAAAAWAAFGRVDTVVNSAVPSGSQEASGDLLHVPEELWAANFDPIVVGALRLARELVPQMAAAGGGAFINLVSPTGVVPAPGMDAYGVAKGALIVLTKYMAREWGIWNIRANALSPGLILDNRHVTEESIQRLPGLRAVMERTALGRPGTTDDLVGPAVFLASEAARFVSGVVLAVDGGRF
jgi:NAD(P)-dependent dehydrogenase (short-subunit alcohol dehydrogenase family)